MQYGKGGLRAFTVIPHITYLSIIAAKERPKCLLSKNEGHIILMITKPYCRAMWSLACSRYLVWFGLVLYPHLPYTHLPATYSQALALAFSSIPQPKKRHGWGLYELKVWTLSQVSHPFSVCFWRVWAKDMNISGWFLRMMDCSMYCPSWAKNPLYSEDKISVLYEKVNSHYDHRYTF